MVYYENSRTASDTVPLTDAVSEVVLFSCNGFRICTLVKQATVFSLSVVKTLTSPSISTERANTLSDCSLSITSFEIIHSLRLDCYFQAEVFDEQR